LWACRLPPAILTREAQARLEQVQLEQARLEQARLEQARLEQARLDQAQLDQAQLGQVQLPQARLGCAGSTSPSCASVYPEAPKVLSGHIRRPVRRGREGSTDA